MLGQFCYCGLGKWPGSGVWACLWGGDGGGGSCLVELGGVGG